MSSESNTVQLFIPCCMDMFSPASAHSLLELLRKVGDKVVYPIEQTCCGFRFYNEGRIDYATELASKLFLDLNPNLPVIVPTTSCSGFVKRYYRQLLENRHIPTDVRNFTTRCYELCYYLVHIKKITNLGNCFPQRVFYFPSCSARNLYGLGNEPEFLLRNTQGIELLQYDNLQLCCAANSKLSQSNGELYDQMLEQIISRVYDMGAQYITATDIHCLQHIDAFVQDKAISGLQTIPIADILNSEL